MVTVVVDTREQEPYGFDSESIASIRKALPAGDYSIEGFETRVAVERKSMADFVSTVIRGRKRFHKELEKLRHYDAACVVVEANYRDVLGACYQSDAHPNALIGTKLPGKTPGKNRESLLCRAKVFSRPFAHRHRRGNPVCRKPVCP